MKTAVCSLSSVSTYGQSKHYQVPYLEGELHKDYEARTWRERCHYDKDGKLFIPPMAFKNCLSEAAKYLSMKIPGKGTKTYTQKFESGVLVIDPMPLPITKDGVEGIWLFVPSDGKRGGGKRVDKCFPIVQQWKGDVTFFVLDDVITEDVFRKHLEVAGNFIGIGFFRPARNGYYGRFKVDSLSWS